jgi:hypothetical protein
MKPEFDGDEVTSFSIDPNLPSGLDLHPVTGVISGRLLREAEVPEATYTITASNEAGESTSELVFAVHVEEPKAFTYPANSSEIYTGQAVLWEPEVVGGRPTDWSVEPELPKGLKLDPASGSIAGVALIGAELRDYTITGTNTGGEISTGVSFEVKVAPPEQLAYPTAEAVYGLGEAIELAPELTLQKFNDSTLSKLVQAESAQLKDLPPVRFRLEPALPEGLVLDEDSGVISGKCASPCEETMYQITVTNEGGEVSTALPLSIKLTPPTSLSYSDVADKYFVGFPLTLEPTVAGLVENWSVEPDLPSGISLDAATGTVSGAPATVTGGSAGLWNITAGNSAGSCSSTLSFQVLHAPPEALEYPDICAEYAFQQRLEIKPQIKGEVDEYSITPALPLGIELDSATGVISGTPEAVAESSTFKVIAQNATGSTSTEVSFGVKLMQPENLSFAGTDALYTVGEALELTPDVHGWVTNYSVEPSLPSGMVIDPTSGVISGVPEAITDELAYVVTASNDAGAASASMSFAIVAPAPTGVSYPAALPNLIVGEEVLLEPEIEGGACNHFAVSPDLPGGLSIDPSTGVICGVPEEVFDVRKYTITAKNVRGSVSVELEFACAEPEEIEVNQAFATKIEEITELADLMEEPSNDTRMGDWMIWMVHRAYLNDPTLVEFNFSNMHMPPSYVEERIAPKLMKAMATNTHIKILALPNSNMQKTQGHELAESLKVNVSLEKLNLENNSLDSDCIRAMASSLSENSGSVISEWKFAYQKGMGGFFGRPVEEAVGQLMEKNSRIVKLGLQCHDAHWRNSIDRCILRNIDYDRKRRKKAEDGDYQDEVVAEEKSLRRLLFGSPPEKPVSEFFDDGDGNLRILRGYVTNTRRLPSAQQLMSFAKSNDTPLKFSIVAPLIKEFRQKIMDSAIGTRVTVQDDYMVESNGVLRAWSEKNENWALDVWPTGQTRYNYTDRKQPIIEVSDEFADWLKPSDWIVPERNKSDGSPAKESP